MYYKYFIKFSNICLVVVSSHASAATIDFESVSAGTQLTNQFEMQGVLFSGTSAQSGLVMTEGQFGTANFGNSPTHIVHAGSYGESTTIQFVDPTNPTSTIGTSTFSLLLGDGNPDTETFSIKFRDISGGILAEPVGYMTTANGLLIQETSESLGALIGFVDIMLDADSPSGVAFDDLSYGVVIPIPAAIWLFGSGLLGLIGVARRKKA